MFTKVKATLDYLITINSLNKKRYSKYYKLYPFTTENIKGYMKDLNFENKKVLTVTGSFDHSLNLILLGCKDITNFDINKLTRYIAEFKIAAIQTLSLNEFITFFNLDNSNSFNYEVFKKIKSSLNKRTTKFFELIYKNGYINKLFVHKYKINLTSNIYLSKKNYLKLKEAINEVNIKFITSNIKVLQEKTKEKFDYIFLSNISDYLKSLYKGNYLEIFSLFVQTKLSKLLKKDGEIICAYIYDYRTKNLNPRTDIDINEKRELYFGNIKFKIKKFKSVINKNKKDAIIIYRR